MLWGKKNNKEHGSIEGSTGKACLRKWHLIRDLSDRARYTHNGGGGSISESSVGGPVITAMIYSFVFYPLRNYKVLEGKGYLHLKHL